MEEIVFYPIHPEESSRARAQRLLRASYHNIPDYRDLPPEALLGRVYRLHNRCTAGNYAIMPYRNSFHSQQMDLAVSDLFSYWFGASPCSGEDLLDLIGLAAQNYFWSAIQGDNQAAMRLQVESFRIIFHKFYPENLLDALTRPFSLQTDLVYRTDMAYLGLVLLLALPDWAFLRVVREMSSVFVTRDVREGQADDRPDALERDMALWEQVQEKLAQMNENQTSLDIFESDEYKSKDWDSEDEEDLDCHEDEIEEDLDDDEDEDSIDAYLESRTIHTIHFTIAQLIRKDAYALVQPEIDAGLTTRRGLILMRLTYPICSSYLNTYFEEDASYEPEEVAIDYLTDLYGSILEKMSDCGFLFPGENRATHPVVSRYWKQLGKDVEKAYLKGIPKEARAVAKAEVPLLQEIHAAAVRSLISLDNDSPDWLYGCLRAERAPAIGAHLYHLLQEESLWVDTRLSALLLQGLIAVSHRRIRWLEQHNGTQFAKAPPAEFVDRLAPLLDALSSPEKTYPVTEDSSISSFQSLMGSVHAYTFPEMCPSREEAASDIWRATCQAVPESDLLLGAFAMLVAEKDRWATRYKRQAQSAAYFTDYTTGILSIDTYLQEDRGPKDWIKSE